MTQDYLARATATIDADVASVWNALVDPQSIRDYMFGTTVSSDWKEGSRITWKGEWQGHSYEDRGIIRSFQPNRRLQYTHFSPISGLPDEPGNYHTVTIDLSADGPRTSVSLTQDNNPSDEERTHVEENWRTMLAGLKRVVEAKVKARA